MALLTECCVCHALDCAGTSSIIPVATITNISDWVVSGRRLHGGGIDVGTLIIYPIGTGGVASQYAQDLVASPDWLTVVYPGATVSGVLFSDNGPEPPPLPPSPRWVG